MVVIADRKLRAWIGENGGWFHDLEIREQDHIRGVFSVKKINQGQIIFSIPVSVFMYPDPDEEQAIMARIGQLTKAPEHHYIPLIVKLLVERKNPDSFWAPYIEILPESPHLKFHDYKKDQLALLQHTSAWPAIKSYDDDTRQEYQDVSVLDGSYLSLTSDDFQWAKSMIFSRVYPTDRYGWEDRLCLIPFVDMINHRKKSDINTVIQFDKQTNSFIGTSSRDIDDGEEIAVCYGPYSNAETLFLYGFTLPCNTVVSSILPIDELNVPLENDDVSTILSRISPFERGLMLTHAIDNLARSSGNFTDNNMQESEYLKEIKNHEILVIALIRLVKKRVTSLQKAKAEYEISLREKLEAGDENIDFSNIVMILDEECSILNRLELLFSAWLSFVRADAPVDLREVLSRINLGGCTPKILMLELNSLDRPSA